MAKFALIFSIFVFCNLCDSANILGFFPTPSISHQVVFHALMKDLAARGHQLTIATTDVIKPLLSNPNVTQIDLHDSYDMFRREFNFVESKDTKQDEIDLMNNFLPVAIGLLDEQFNHPDVRKIISNSDGQNFDVIIIEYLATLYDSLLALGEVYDAPIVGFTSLDSFSLSHEFNGNVMNPVIHPDVVFDYKPGTLNFYQRFRSLRYYLNLKLHFYPKTKTRSESMIAQYFPNVTQDIEQLRNNVKFMLVNANPALGFIRPILPNTIQLGFMHIEPPRPLPSGELKSFLDNSKHGVIYMSFGSNVQSKDLGTDIRNIFLNVFRDLKYDILWKFENDSLTNKPDNVKISKWLPQSDLLAHESIKLFITQGGQQSMEEAIDRTIPTIVIPFLGDQDANAKRMVDKGVGYHLELHTLTEERLKNAIDEMLKPKYKQQVQHLRNLVNDQPMSARERAVWWTEYAIRHKGADHLDYLGSKVPFYQKYWIDFIVIALALALTSLTALYFTLKKLVEHFVIRSEKMKQK